MSRRTQVGLIRSVEPTLPRAPAQPSNSGRERGGPRWAEGPCVRCPLEVAASQAARHHAAMDVHSLPRVGPVATVNEASEALRAVLLAVPGGDDDVAAARVAAVDVAGRSRAPLHLLLVWQASRAPGSLPAAVLASAAAAKLEDEVRAVVDGGGTVSGSHLRQGFPAKQILAVAGQLNARLIVIGAHGGGPFFRFLHDSVSEAVVRGSGFPVLVIRSGPPAWPPRQVVIGDDGSKASDRVVLAGGWFAGLLGAPVRLVAVRGGNKPPPSDSVIARHARTIAGIVGVAPDMLTPDGDPVDRILAAASERDTLVVVGHRWPGRIEAWEKRVSTSLLHEHQGPSLIVPRPLSAALRG
jgi:nucleotide-binding universal stress UspA family protein